ncbi:PLP-dependent transferase [Exidia glandulosa HHB12029]|uniref:cystathionine gamma-synthase n=1 Tax=Exidia glandulosa HHB12029 TaxID=1314781 RepID=A0A165HYM7_EXIGL|nr:PLP-dependent transferase [Exidia glandulosa HHB12029]
MSLGDPIPAYLPHAISVSLPTWRDNIDYEEGAKRVVDVMQSGYPRFFIALNIQKLASIIAKRFAKPGELCMLFPSAKVAEACRAFMLSQGVQTPIRVLQYAISKPADASAAPIVLHVVVYAEAASSQAKAFWQHTGLGISSRTAEACLARLSDDGAPSPTGTRTRTARYSVKKSAASPPSAKRETEVESGLHTTLIEERYGRNLPASAADNAKRVLRRRIAGVLVQDRSSIDDPDVVALLSDASSQIAPSVRVAGVTEDDVFLLPTGMSAIWTAHQLALATRPSAKSICFGFPYTDTLKILQKWGPGCEFFGHGLDSDLDALETLLAAERTRNPSTPPALALFTEFPSNPLLRSSNLRRLRELADKYDFLIVIDETIGNFANVEVLPYADVVVSSLTKIFSGAVNVMGGSLVLNPRGRHYAALQAHMRETFEDVYWPEDAIYLESNSRNFVRRAHTINQNTEAVCEFLRAHPAVVKDVFYPKYETREHYDACRLREPLVPEWPTGFGGLFSVTFHTLAASRAFFDALPCAKGPSLGTNFTLACPYTILAHYHELQWAAKYGVEEGLVRVSIGLEPVKELLESARVALKAAESAMNAAT